MAPAELTIAEVAERTGLTRHTLRYYERDGLMLGVDRAGSGHRRYSEHDLGWIELITKLRATGMPIREVRRYAERVRAQLETMAAYLGAIDVKISYYADAIGAGESPDGYLSSPSPAAASVPG